MTKGDATEDLSALVDGDYQPGRLNAVLEDIATDDALRSRWQRYHLMRSALRGDPVSSEYESIAARLSARLDQESVDAQVAPSPAPPQSAVGARARSRTTWRKPRWLNSPSAAWWPMGGAALAGAFTLAFLSVLPVFQGPDPIETPRVAGAPGTEGPVPPSALASAPGRDAAQRPAANLDNASVPAWALGQPGLQSKLNFLLVGHQERVSASSIKGFLPYATLVGYETQP